MQLENNISPRVRGQADLNKTGRSNGDIFRHLLVLFEPIWSTLLIPALFVLGRLISTITQPPPPLCPEPHCLSDSFFYSCWKVPRVVLSSSLTTCLHAFFNIFFFFVFKTVLWATVRLQMFHTAHAELAEPFTFSCEICSTATLREHVVIIYAVQLIPVHICANNVP